MVSGFQEILVLAVIVLVILFLPRIIHRGQDRLPMRSLLHRFPLTISGRRRLAIVASVVWPAAAAAYLKPWLGDWIPFFYLGIGPVALGWSLVWVFSGYKKKRN